MIYDLLANIGNYRGMNRNLDKAIDYLMTVDINTLPLGKTEIDGDRVFLQVMEARTHELQMRVMKCTEIIWISR